MTVNLPCESHPKAEKDDLPPPNQINDRGTHHISWGKMPTDTDDGQTIQIQINKMILKNNLEKI